MRDACLNAIEAALGKALTAAQRRNLDRRIREMFGVLARRDASAWSAMSLADRYVAVGAEVGKGLREEALKVLAAEEENVLIADRIKNAVIDRLTKGVKNGGDDSALTGIERVLRAFGDGRDERIGVDVEAKAAGGFKIAIAEISDVLRAAKAGAFRFLPLNDPFVNERLRRINAGLEKGPPAIQAALKKYHDLVDRLWERRRALGGNGQRLEDWHETHVWSEDRLWKRLTRDGMDKGAIAKNKAELAEEFYGHANRTKYVRDDGARMSDDEVRAFMSEALETVLSDGANKRNAARAAGEAIPKFGATPANKFAAHRQIHLTPEGEVALLRRYSDLNFMESMVRHLRAMTREIALMETLGRNYQNMYAHLADWAEDFDLASKREAPGAVGKRRAALDTLMEHVSASYGFKGSRKLAAAGATVRALQAALHLGMARFASISDMGTLYHVAAARDLDAGRLWVADIASWAGFGRRWARRAGLLTDTLIGAADRYGYDNFNVKDMGASAASFTMRGTGLNWDTEGRRLAYGMMMMDSLGHLTRQYADMAKMKADDVRLARILGVNQATWDIWRLAKLDSHGGKHTLLTAQAIMDVADADIARIAAPRIAALRTETAAKIARIMGTPDALMSPEAKRASVATQNALLAKQIDNLAPANLRYDAAQNLMGVIAADIDNAVTTAGAKDRAEMLGDQGKAGSGTWWGELRRSIVLFKSFPWSNLRRQLEVSASLGKGFGRYAYGVSLFLSMSMLGIVANWLYDIVNGRDPRGINVWSGAPEDRALHGANIVSGILRGGGLGIVGDLILPEANPAGGPNTLSSTVGGPMLGLAEDTYNLGPRNVAQAIEAAQSGEGVGEATNVGPEALRFAARHATPNWWPTQFLFKRVLLARAQEAIEPGYVERLDARAEAMRGTRYINAPGQLPHRAPDFARTVAED